MADEKAKADALPATQGQLNKLREELLEKVKAADGSEALSALSGQLSKLREELEKAKAADGGEALLAMQGQLNKLREELDRTNGTVDELTDPSSNLEARVAAVEFGVCLAAAILGELYSSSCKSDISGLVSEIKKLVVPMNEAREAAAQERANVAA